MQMFTYALAEVASTAIDQGADGMFDLSGFFEAKKVGTEYHFTDPGRVDEFLNMLRGKLTPVRDGEAAEQLPPSLPVQRRPFRQRRSTTRVWFLPTVASCHAMKAALEATPVLP